MNKKNRRYPIIPSIWKNPQNLRQYIRAYSKNVLNIIPTRCLTEKHYTFPSIVGDTHYISDPEILRDILKTNIKDFPKSKVLDLAISPIIPNSIFITKGQKWQDQHKTMIPVFNHRNIAGFKPIIEDYVDRFLDETDLTTLNNQDITVIFRDLTFKIISLALMGDENDERFQELHDFFTEYSQTSMRTRIYDIFFLKIPYFPNLRKLFYARFIRQAKGFGSHLVEERLKTDPPETMDFLEVMIEAFDLRQNPSPEGIAEVRDNLNTFLVAGHETTAISLVWALYAASFFPVVQKRMGEEAGQPLEKRLFTESHLKETMRVYPAASILVRRNLRKSQFGDLKMKRNAGIIVPVIALHRHRDYWQEPDVFNPRRFMNFTPAPMTYLPFGAGPRICIGASFAMMEANIILSKILERYQIKPSEHTPQPLQMLTLQSKNGIKLVFEPRPSKNTSPKNNL